MLLSFSDSLSGLFLALLGVYLFFASSAINLHFFLGVFLHFIIGADTSREKVAKLEQDLKKAQEQAERLKAEDYDLQNKVLAAQGRDKVQEDSADEEGGGEE